MVRRQRYHESYSTSAFELSCASVVEATGLRAQNSRQSSVSRSTVHNRSTPPSAPTRVTYTAKFSNFVARRGRPALLDEVDDDPVVRVDTATVLSKRPVEERRKLEQHVGERISAFRVAPRAGAGAVLDDDVLVEGLERRTVVTGLGRVQQFLH